MYDLVFWRKFWHLGDPPIIPFVSPEGWKEIIPILSWDGNYWMLIKKELK